MSDDQRQEMARRRAALLSALENARDHDARVEIQSRIGAINADLRRMNTAAAEEARQIALARRAAGKAEHEANQRRALAVVQREARRTPAPRVQPGDDGAPPSYGEMLLIRAKQTQRMIQTRLVAASTWPHVAAFLPHLDAFVAAQEQYLVAGAASASAPAEPAQNTSAADTERWAETWKDEA